MSSWIQTYTGRQFTPLDPQLDDIDILDIAHALSLLCRYNGHCRSFYSVADHSVRVSRIVPQEDALWGLLHDAAEAYVGDFPRPIKRQMPVFRDLEDRILQVVMQRFGLGWPMPDTVKEADDILLVTEKRDLVKAIDDPWGPVLPPLPETIVPLSPEASEQAFLERFRELTAGLAEKI